MIQIKLNNVKVFAHHGWHAEEAALGNYFIVDVCVDVAQYDLHSDKLEDTLDYAVIHRIIQNEMATRSALLEHVIARMKSAIVQSDPDKIRALYICIKKLNPPLQGEVGSSEVILLEDYRMQCAKCGTDMGCFKEDCWCHNIPLSDVTRSQIARQYNGCLCQRCLKAS